MDEEAHEEYDNAPRGRSREGSFNSRENGSFHSNEDNSIASSVKKNPQSIQSSLKETILAKSRKRKINANKRQNLGTSKTLTFVDMSHLSYLSKSVSADMHLNKKIDKIVAIPTSTKIAIIEDESEEDSDSDSI
jgi:hypothetical protein